MHRAFDARNLQNRNLHLKGYQNRQILKKEGNGHKALVQTLLHQEGPLLLRRDQVGLRLNQPRLSTTVLIFSYKERISSFFP